MIVWCGNLTILLSGLTFHCFWYRKQKTLCDSLHRPSRSDFVQFGFVGELRVERRPKTGKNRSCSDCSWLDLKHHYCLDHLPSPPLKHPFLFWFMRICEGNFRTEEQKNGSPESFLDAPFRRGGQGILMTLE